MNNLQIYSSFPELAHVVDCPRPAPCCPSLLPLPLPPLPAPPQALGAAGGSAWCLEHPYMPLGAHRAAPHDFYLRTPFPRAFFFLLLCPFPQRHRQDQALWWNLLELPRQCHALLTEPLRRLPEAIFLSNIPLLLARVLLFTVEVSPCHMWRKSAPKSHIGLLWLHSCVPTQLSVPRMGGSWQEPDKLYTYLSCSASVTLLAIS